MVKIENNSQRNFSKPENERVRLGDKRDGILCMNINGVKEIGFAEVVDRIIRPERDPTGEVTDIGNMKGKVAEIICRLDLKLIAIAE